MPELNVLQLVYVGFGIFLLLCGGPALLLLLLLALTDRSQKSKKSSSLKVPFEATVLRPQGAALWVNRKLIEKIGFMKFNSHVTVYAIDGLAVRVTGDGEKEFWMNIAALNLTENQLIKLWARALPTEAIVRQSNGAAVWTDPALTKKKRFLKQGSKVMVYEFLPHCFRITEQAPHEYMNVIVLEVTFSEAKTGLDKVMKYLERVKQIRKTFAH